MTTGFSPLPDPFYKKTGPVQLYNTGPVFCIPYILFLCSCAAPAPLSWC